MAENADRVTLWCLVETLHVTYIGEGKWPAPRNPEERSELNRQLLFSLLSGISRIVPVGGTCSLTLMLNGVPGRSIASLMRANEALQAELEGSAEQLTWSRSLLAPGEGG